MDDYLNWAYGIVPLDYPNIGVPTGNERAGMPPSQAPSYETPWWVDSVNRAIERAAQIASLEVAGYPPTPPLPTATPRTTQAYPYTQTGDPRGVQISQTTLMLLVGGVLLFMLGGKKGR